ncbi:MAG: macro domain-containing protein [Deltaproteobacteria bacterium]|nr:macro domain-containing protein [Deltaproteobacteria bacterium]
MSARIVEGDLLDQETEAIVNAWNRNIIPWWLLIPQGVSGAIKRQAGTAPFRELARKGPIPLGGAVATSAGRLHYKAIIHVAGINVLWRASRESIAGSVQSAIHVARTLELRSIAFPIIGAGSGGFQIDQAERIMCEELERQEVKGVGNLDATRHDLEVVIVRFARKRSR